MSLAKCVFDRVVAFMGLLFLGWFFVIIAILVKIDFPKESVFFKQIRVGKDGRLFKIHKFRTMADGADVSNIAYPNRARVTRLGAWLRLHKIDELPELWDVFVGKMSFVGPRPDVPGYADCLQGDDRVVLRMRPGITGPATLKYRDEERIIGEYVKKAQADGDARSEEEIARWYNDEVIYPDKVRINVAYYHNYSFFNDIKIIFQTIL